ncbi:AraC family transcriptional regulator [Cloacibacillus sp. An23]|uniref:AraC family transcriptional regulator n=1 Tax=Cloacibacillus sp. An23 TaxID=1965591 RepID=UPI001302823F|nr:AraC family transcriptional regulator [Cloacibacillus sp. An23]
MINYRPILVDSTLQELTEHGDFAFPMSMDEQRVSDSYVAFVPHWHYEIQISAVVKGSVIFRTPENEFRLEKGEAVFFNSGCIHEAVPTEDKDGVYTCVNFHPKVVYGYAESLLRQDYVNPVLYSNELQAIVFRDEPWHLEVRKLMDSLIAVNRAERFGYELEMYSIILKIWHLIVQNNESLISASSLVSFADKQRIRSLTHFIHKNYMERISLTEIAESDHISKGECCRVFQRVLGTTPFAYLINYRIHQGMKMLATTDHNISEIAQSVGFGSGSYFTECFKKMMHCSPMQYRKHIRKEGKSEDAPRPEEDYS